MLVAQAKPTAHISSLFSLLSSLLFLLLAMAAGTAEVFAIVLGSGWVAVSTTEKRKELVAVSKTMNREVRRGLLMCHADFNRRYSPEMHISFIPMYIVYRPPSEYVLDRPS